MTPFARVYIASLGDTVDRTRLDWNIIQFHVHSLAIVYISKIPTTLRPRPSWQKHHSPSQAAVSAAPSDTKSPFLPTTCLKPQYDFFLFLTSSSPSSPKSNTSVVRNMPMLPMPPQYRLPPRPLPRHPLLLPNLHFLVHHNPEDLPRNPPMRARLLLRLRKLPLLATLFVIRPPLRSGPEPDPEHGSRRRTNLRRSRHVRQGPPQAVGFRACRREDPSLVRGRDRGCDGWVAGG